MSYHFGDRSSKRGTARADNAVVRPGGRPGSGRFPALQLDGRLGPPSEKHRGSFEVVKRPELGRDTDRDQRGVSATSRSEVLAIPGGIVGVIG